MKRVIGFALFGVAAGMLLALLLPTVFLRVIIMFLCALVAYVLFCC